MTNWQRVPNYSVVKGPLCVKVRRWGFPHGPVHPLFTPSRLHMDITYVWYAGLPYFFKYGRIEAVQDVKITYLRDDEWLFAGQPFTDSLWMDREGALHEGPVASGHQDDLWGVGFFNRNNRAAFIALWLEHSAVNFTGLYHSGAPALDYAGDIHLWSRWAARGEPHFAAGAVLKQKNAYLVSPYETAGAVEETREKLLHPLLVQAGELPMDIVPAAEGTLAREGETRETAPLKPLLWEALGQVRDDQFYAVEANVVDMGYIYDLQVRQGQVRVLMTMPHRGRPQYRYLAEPIRQQLLKVDGVHQVEVDFTWEPAWSTARLRPQGRKLMGLED